MKDYLLEELKPGMMFTDTAYVEEDTIFVPANVKISDKDIERLAKLNVGKVASRGDLVSESHSAASDNRRALAQLAFHKPAQRQLMDRYIQWCGTLQNTFNQIKRKAIIEREPVLGIIAEATQLLAERRNDMIQFILYGVQGSFGLVGNAINGTVIASLLAAEFGMNPAAAEQLALSTILRDAGMMKIPEGILEKHNELDKQELQLIKTHPLHTYKILTKDMGLSEEVATSALQHHERWDGTGYPRGLKGKDISLEGRLISVADAFEAMVSVRPYRDPILGYTAVRNILQDNGRRFDPEVVKVFIRSFGIYPIGSIVLLSDASIGRVVENHPEIPLRPKIKIMISSDGTQHLKDDGEELDLKARKGIFIVKAVDPRETAAAVVGNSAGSASTQASPANAEV